MLNTNLLISYTTSWAWMNQVYINIHMSFFKRNQNTCTLLCSSCLCSRFYIDVSGKSHKLQVIHSFQNANLVTVKTRIFLIRPIDITHFKITMFIRVHTNPWILIKGNVKHFTEKNPINRKKLYAEIFHPCILTL